MKLREYLLNILENRFLFNVCRFLEWSVFSNLKITLPYTSGNLKISKPRNNKWYRCNIYIYKMNKKVSVYRKEHFNAAHRLHNPAWDENRNNLVFGKCNNPNFHGHNYDLVVKITGEPAHDTGFVIDLKFLSDMIKENILEKLDHKNLNMDVPEFADLNPTVENIAIVIYNILRSKVDEKLDMQIRLYETERNYAEYPAN